MIRDSGASPESNRTWMAIDEDEEEIGEESSKGFEEDPLNRYFDLISKPKALCPLLYLFQSRS